MNKGKKVLFVAGSLLAFSITAAQAAEKTGEKPAETKTSKTQPANRDTFEFFAGPRPQSAPPQSIFGGSTKSSGSASGTSSSSSSSTPSSGGSTASKAD